MATVVIEKLSDSLDERIKNDVENVVFFHPLTGEKLEIQLGKANREHFARHLAKLDKYIDAAEVVPVPVVEQSKPKAAAKNSETSKMRVWAKANGFNIGDRGRISAEIQAAYAAAHEVIVSEPETTAEPVSEAEPTAETESQDPSEQDLAEAESFLSDDDVMALLDEVTGESEVDESTEQE